MPQIIPSTKKRKGIAGCSLVDVVSEAENKALEGRALAPFQPFGRKDDGGFLSAEKLSMSGGNDKDHMPAKTLGVPQKNTLRRKHTPSSSSWRKSKNQTTMTTPPPITTTTTTTPPQTTTPRTTIVDTPMWLLEDNRCANGDDADTTRKPQRVPMDDGKGEVMLMRITPEANKKCDVGNDGINIHETRDWGSADRPVEHELQRQETLEILPCQQCQTHRIEMDELKSSHEKTLKFKEALHEVQRNDLKREIEKLRAMQEKTFARLVALLPDNQHQFPAEAAWTSELWESVLSTTEETMLASSERVRELDTGLKQATLDLNKKTQETKLLTQQLQECTEKLRQQEDFSISPVDNGNGSLIHPKKRPPEQDVGRDTSVVQGNCPTTESGICSLLENLEKRHGHSSSNNSDTATTMSGLDMWPYSRQKVSNRDRSTNRQTANATTPGAVTLPTGVSESARRMSNQQQGRKNHATDSTSCDRQRTHQALESSQTSTLLALASATTTRSSQTSLSMRRVKSTRPTLVLTKANNRVVVNCATTRRDTPRITQTHVKYHANNIPIIFKPPTRSDTTRTQRLHSRYHKKLVLKTPSESSICSV